MRRGRSRIDHFIFKALMISLLGHHQWMLSFSQKEDSSCPSLCGISMMHVGLEILAHMLAARDDHMVRMDKSTSMLLLRGARHEL